MSLSPHSILIVDDEPIVGSMLKTMLVAAGHRATWTSNGNEALEIIQQQAFDVVITDVFMPDMDGFEVIDKLRSRNTGVRIVAMSGGGVLPGKMNLEVAQKLGAHARLLKPFGIRQLLTAIEAALAA